MKKRTLSLKRESLTELGVSDLTAVVGGVLPTTPVKECRDELLYTWTPTRCFCP